MFFLIFGLVIILLLIFQDWLTFKMRGRANLNSSHDENPPVITGPEDATAQRLADLYTDDQPNQSKESKKILGSFERERRDYLSERTIHAKQSKYRSKS